MKKTTASTSSTGVKESDTSSLEWSPSKIEQNSSTSSSNQTKSNTLSYKDKFRAKVKTVLSNVRDLEIEEYDQQKRKQLDKADNTNEGSQVLFTGSALGVDDDPVDPSNVVNFAKKAFIILGLQLLMATVWVFCICHDEDLFNQIYADSETFIILALLALVLIFSSLYFSKKVFGSYKTHIAISSALTLSLGYLFGALALLINYKTMLMSFVMSLSFITGLVVYCKLTADGLFNPRHSTMSGSLALAFATSVIYFWTDTGAWTILALYLVSNIFGIALVFKVHLAAENSESNLLMKHYIFFAMLLYIDFIKALAQTMIATLNYRTQKVEPQAPKDPNPDTQINLFSFNPETEVKCL